MTGLRNYKVVDEKFSSANSRGRSDSDFKGIMDKRECTDVFCCLLFGISLAAWVVLAVIAVALGHPERLFHPTDSKGRICGLKTDLFNLQDRPYLFFFDLSVCTGYSTVIQGCQTPQVCVAKCPDDFYTLSTYYIKESKNFHQILPYCSEDLNKTQVNLEWVQNAVDKGICPGYYVPQRPVFQRCIPKIIADIGDAAERNVRQSLIAIIDENFNQTVNDSNIPDNTKMPSADSLLKSQTFVRLSIVAKDVGERIFADFRRIWWQMAVAICFVVIVSFFWIVLMRWISAVMIWLSIALLTLALAISTSLSWYWWYQLQFAGGKSLIPIPKQSESYMYFTEIWLGVAIGLSLALFLFLILIIFLWKRIWLAIALLRESSRALVHIKSALLFPIFPFLCYLVLFVFWGFSAVHLASIGQPHCQVIGALRNSSSQRGNTDCSCSDAVNFSQMINSSSASCRFVEYRKDTSLIVAQVFNIFLLFWSSFFISALSHVTLAGAFASYYWAYNKPDDIPRLPVLKSFGRAVRYHLGSLAFGSLVLALVKITRIVMEFVEEKLKKYDNPAVKCCLCWFSCFTWCLESFLKFLTNNAYILLAIYGKSFFWSGREAFELIARNAVRVVVLDRVTDFLLFIGQLIIVIGNGILWGFYFGGYFGGFTTSLVRDLNYYYVPVIVVVVVSWAVTGSFFNVFEQAVDTTFLCFLEDSERNDGSNERPYYMSKDLLKILSK